MLGSDFFFDLEIFLDFAKNQKNHKNHKKWQKGQTISKQPKKTKHVKSYISYTIGAILKKKKYFSRTNLMLKIKKEILKKNVGK